MEFLQSAFDFLLHFDQYLTAITHSYGLWVYLFLFLIIFAETGFVVTPFLPGDSLLFMVGAISALGSLNIFAVFITLSLAAILGDSLNYAMGKIIGYKIFKCNNARFFKKEHLDLTQKFYEKHGAKTIILARFVPIVRTFAPFLAGVGKMDYAKFIVYNISGGIAWVAIFVFGGFSLGNIPFVKNNFSLAALIIIFVSILPIAIKFLKYRFKTGKIIKGEPPVADLALVEEAED
ncbi:MAG: DedA family protein [Candidatus Omnitrophota bacterium]|nr:DedA family protein [Candidatus Omnitrophota bacterium]